MKIIIIGGGFGGITVARALKNVDVEILLFDKTNHHLFQPLLYQVATASLPASNIATSFREIFRKQKNIIVLMANVVNIDRGEQKIYTDDRQNYSYDYLVLAPGARHSYFDHSSWELYAPGLKTVADATDMRERMLFAFERAEKSGSTRYLNFAIIGAGPTGVEIAGSLAEFVHKTLVNNFRMIKPEESKIYLIEAQNQVLPGYPKKLAEKALSYLEKLGVTVLLDTYVKEVEEERIYIEDHFLDVPTIIWAAGNQASPLLKTLNCPLDKQGRVIVNEDLSINGSPNVFIIGDAAQVKDKKGNLLPAIAPAAIQEGKYVANIIKRPSQERKPFVYFDKGMLATIGRGKAVGIFREIAYSGLTAWLIWGLIHIFYLISFRNRLLVLIQWIYLYLRGNRPNRIIHHSIDKIDHY